MELVYDVIIRNIPDVLKSRDLLFRRLRDKAEEKGMSDILLCIVTPCQQGRSGTGFASCIDLTDNERLAQWSGMVFHGQRLEFEANRVARIQWRNVEELWNQTQREPQPKGEPNSEPKGEQAREPARERAKEVESEPEADYASLFREEGWDD